MASTVSRGFPDTGSVNEPQTGGTQQHRFLHRIPGGAGNVGDDAAVKPCQRVQKTGLAHIGFAHNGGGHALPEDTPLTVGLQQGIQRFGIAPKAFAVLFKPKILDILVWVVQHRVEMAAQIGQVVVNRARAAFAACRQPVRRRWRRHRRCPLR